MKLNKRFLRKQLLISIIICFKILFLIFIPLLIILILVREDYHNLTLKACWKILIILECKIKIKQMHLCHCCLMNIQNYYWRSTLWGSNLIILSLRIIHNLMFKKLLLINYMNFLKIIQPILFKKIQKILLKMKEKKN